MKKNTNSNVTFIFKLLNKKMVMLCLFLEALSDFIYYIIPFSFTFLLTLPFTTQKAIMVSSIFIISKLLNSIICYLLRKFSDSYLYQYSNTQYLEYFKQVIQVPIEKLSKYQTGYLENIIRKTSELVQSILQAEYLSIILSFVFFFYTVYNQSKSLFIISLIISIICLITSINILKKSNKKVEELYDQEYIYSSVYQDYISNIRTVKTLNNNKYFQNKIKEEGNKCHTKFKKYLSYYAFEELVRNTLINIPFILAILKAVIDLSNGKDTIGLIAFYISLQVEMDYIFNALSGNIINWFELHALSKKCKNLFNNLDKRKTLPTFNTIELNNIMINYKGLSFSIKIDNLKINRNDKILITGKSGQGKTSFINLIIGNISTYKGEITIDNENIKNNKLDIGVVSQETELFNMSIRDNLILDSKVNDEDLIKYLKELELDEILLLEDGINTIVGEKGFKLSTGQKRRLNILRSYLMNKSIYVLDEPTSNLDKNTENIVINFLKKYFKDKTLIISTHNNNLKALCNSCYEFKDHSLKMIASD